MTPQGREIFDRLTEATAGRYEIQRELGRGGMAVVFLGFQKSLDRYVAIKVLSSAALPLPPLVTDRRRLQTVGSVGTGEGWGGGRSRTYRKASAGP